MSIKNSYWQRRIMKDITPRKREEFIDIFRAIGIILMIMGHVGFGSIFGKWIHAFHMPMFFFVSGWFFKTDIEVSVFVKKKIKALLVPYFIWGLLSFIYGGVIWNQWNNYQALCRLFTYNNDGLMIAGALWFLTALFFAEVGYYFLNKLIKNYLLQTICVTIIFVFGLIVRNILQINLLWSLDSSFVGIGLMHIAYSLHNKIHLESGNMNKYIKLTFFILLCSMNLILILKTPEINMRVGNYSYYFLPNALAAIYILWIISKIIARLKNRLINMIKKIGENSIVYLCANECVIVFFRKIFSYFNIPYKEFLVLISTLIILICLERLILNTKLKVLIGR